jgi:hypothetical protein
MHYPSIFEFCPDCPSLGSNPGAPAIGCERGLRRRAAARDERIKFRPVTYHPLARLEINLVRRNSITPVLLILVLATSVSACVSGWGSQEAACCPHSSAQQTCKPKNLGNAGVVDPACGHGLESLPGKCDVRSFVQSQFIAYHAFETSTLLRCAVSNISAPSDSVIVVSSIGSPETDRGPPGS